MKDDMERPDLMNISDDEANNIIDRHIQKQEQKDSTCRKSSSPIFAK